MDLLKKIDALIELAITEDIGQGDITSDACLSDLLMSSGRFYLKQSGIVAGLPLIELLFKKINPKIKITECLPEGSFQKAGTPIAKISGPVKGILAGERIALNLLQYVSGIATLTSEYVRKVKGTSCQILDTRRTLPGLRALAKYGVQVGGGISHRWGLDDRFIIKSNHLYFMETEETSDLLSITDKASRQYPNVPIEIEVSDEAQLEKALKSPAHAVILCQISPGTIKKWISKIKASKKKAYIDAHGTITLDTVRAFAETGADGIMISLAHSVQEVEIGMRFTTQ